ncbi:bicyclomycin/multidrug efflux system [Pelomyxa schiedti]|nr:bicyclomycin/multidrug efflux system [Pelomyxa schiedti]
MGSTECDVDDLRVVDTPTDDPHVDVWAKTPTKTECESAPSADSSSSQSTNTTTGAETRGNVGVVAATVTEKKMSARHIALFVEMVFISFCVSFVDTIIVPALPTISKQFEGDVVQQKLIPWILTVYMLVGAISTPIIGGLDALFSPLIVVAVPLVIYIFGLLIGGIWGDESVLILVICRGFMGFGLPVFVIFYGVIKREFPEKLVPLSLGCVSAMFSVGASIGFLGGAALMARVSYNEVFFVVLPIAVISGAAVILTMGNATPSRIINFFKKKERKQEVTSGESLWRRGWKQVVETFRQVDFLGGAIVAIGAGSLLVGMTMGSAWGWTSPESLCTVILGALFIFLFVLLECWLTKPLVPMRLMLSVDLFFLTLMSFQIGLVIFSIFQALPFLMTSPIMPFKYDKQFQVGLLMFPSGITILFTAPLTGAVCRLIGSSLCVSLAVLLHTVPMVILIWCHTKPYQIVICNILQGAGLGGIFTAQMTVLADKCTKRNFAGASGLFTFFRTIGGAVGPIVTDFFLSETVPYEYPNGYTVNTTSEEGYTHVFIFCACVSFSAFLSSLVISGHLDVFTHFLNWRLEKQHKKQEQQQGIELEPYELVV